MTHQKGRASALPFFRCEVDLGSALLESAWEERFEDLGNVACNDDIGHQFRCNGCQLEAVAEVSSREVEAVQIGRTQHGQATFTEGPQTSPAFDEC